MNELKQRIKSACFEKDLPISNMLMSAGIQSGDFYMAINGKKPFYRGWRKRISEVLDKREEDLFPEFTEKEYE
ncbi:hypothetical protein [Lutispora sp.]|uniref:hypothetical protein n=1 Tax=Lutispora sp. TaxID=2828727 RepID=UPI003566652E